MSLQQQSEIQSLCKKYEVNLVKTGELSKKYNCIVFTQAYNEQRHASAFLENIRSYSDGVVVLDDGSTDGTGELFMGDQVVIHLRRPVNSMFNDFNNRNLLMELGVVLNTRWLLFLDLDERLDTSGIPAFKWLTKLPGLDFVRFRYVHLWDSPDQFRTDYPHSEQGVQYRLKMIRRKDAMLISDPRRMHFELKPYRSEREMRSHLLVLHLGSLLKEDRQRRYNVYKSLDPDNQCQSSYEHLVSTHVRFGKVHELFTPWHKVVFNDWLSYIRMIRNVLIKRRKK